MAIVSGKTAAFMQSVVDASLLDARLDGADLVFVRYDESEVNVGPVKGDKGDDGDPGAPGPPGSQPPTGGIISWAGSAASIPAGWLPCFGQDVSRSTYSALFSVIGVLYGEGDGVDTFTLPDLRLRMPIGVSEDESELAANLGHDTVTLVTANLPEHTHTINHDHPSATTSSAGAHTHSFGRGASTGSSSTRVANGNVTDTSALSTSSAGTHTHTVDLPAFSGSSGSTGSSEPFDIRPRSLGLHQIIKT